MSKRIKLTNCNKYTIVDDMDYVFLMQWQWYATAFGHVVRSGYDKTHVFMHRVLCQPPANMVVDHVDRDPLNNQKGNLRIVSQSLNARNTTPAYNQTSPFKGVSLTSNRWQAKITINDQPVVIGRYLTQREAAIAYNRVARKLFGDNNYMNDVSILSPESDPPLETRYSSSSYIGVHKNETAYVAQICDDLNKLSLGSYQREARAAMAYDDYVILNNLDRPINFPLRREGVLKNGPMRLRPEELTGAFFNKKLNKWQAYVGIGKSKTKHLGLFPDAYYAARVRDAYVREHDLGYPLNFRYGPVESFADLVAPYLPKKKEGFTGVYQRVNGQWYADIKIKGKTKNLGTFGNESEAALARDAFIKTNGLSHALNFPDQ